MRPTAFTVSTSARPLLVRLQPVTWLVLGLLLIFAGLAGLTVARQRARAAEQLGQPMPTFALALADVSQQQATRTPRPTNTARPTADRTATFFAQLGVRQTAAVKKSTAEARATQAIATFTPSPPTPTIYPSGYRAPWADKMVKQADGTWMAPKEVVEEAARHYGEYYAWLKTKDIKFVRLTDEIQLKTYSRFYSGRALVERAEFIANSKVDNILKNPDGYRIRMLRVHRFSSDGLRAICDIEFQGSQWLVVDVASGATSYEYATTARIDSSVLVYDASDSRWKVTEDVASVPLKQR
jgi:hypothetical protein